MGNTHIKMYGKAGIVFFFLLAFAVLAGGGLFATDSHAYQRYNDGCQNCHGAFTSGSSPKGTVFGGGSKHEMHRSSSFMNTDCNLCHTSGDNRNPYTGSSDGLTGITGRGCTGCHNAAGLRNHHRTTGASSCSCHGSSAEAAPVESTQPPYYGTTATKANNACNPVATANLNENWSVGDFLGLDNDGDDLYDSSDPNCTPVAALAITTASLPAGTVNAAYSQTLAATGGTTPYSWSVSAGTLPAGLSLSAAGVLGGTPTTAGTSNFTVQVTGGGTATKAFSVTINPAAVTLSSIAISGPASVNEGLTGNYTATATWSNGTTSNVTNLSTWSENSSFATISSGGVLTASQVTANQTVTVSASYTSGTTTRTASVSVTITNVAATLSSIAISGPASVNESTTGNNYTATATWSDGTTSNVTSAATWTTTLGTISAGVLSAPSVTANQTATVGASYASGTTTRTASVSVTITNVAATLSSIAISGLTTVNSGATATYIATATWSDGTTQAVPATWSVSPTTYATINPSTGVLTAGAVTANQTVVVSASYTSGSATKTDSRSVTIAYVQATLNSITISGSASVNENATATYTATATWGDGTTTSVSPTWSVSPTTYANVSTSGVLTTLAVTSNQSVTLTASYTSGGATKTDARTVTIVDVPQQTGTVNTMPQDNAVDVPMNTVVIVTNSGTPAIDTIFNRNTFTLKPEVATSDSSIAASDPFLGSVCVKDGIVKGSFRYNKTRTKGTFIPNCFLATGTKYVGEITTAADSSSRTEPIIWEFTTIASSPDSDNDGSPDSGDDHPRDKTRTSLWAPNGTGKIGIDTTGTSGTSISTAIAISDGSARLNQAGTPEGYEFLDGMVSFRADGIASGSNGTFRITFPSEIPAGSKVYQVDSNGFHVVPSAIVSGNTVTMTIPGGSPSVNGAQDNGVLIDPVGVASPETSASGSIDLASSSSGGGCSIVGGTRSGGSNIDAVLILAGLALISWRSRIQRRRK